MNCPKCGKEMAEGNLHTHKYPFWTQQEPGFFRGVTDKVEIGPTDDDDTSMFTRDVFPNFPWRDALPGLWNGLFLWKTD